MSRRRPRPDQNADIVKQVSQQIKQHCPKAIVVVVSNPLDVMLLGHEAGYRFRARASLAWQACSTRRANRSFLAEALDVSVRRYPGDGYSGATATRWYR